MTTDSPPGVHAPPTDAAAVLAARDRSEAFTTIFDRHHRVVHAYLARRVGSAVADDLAGETFLRALAAVHRYDPTWTDARPWLLGIATNLVRRHRRAELRAYRALARHQADPILDHAEGVAARVTAQAHGPALGRALASLATRDRDVLLLVAYADLTYEQVAHALDIPIGTVRSRLHRARTVLRRTLAEEENRDG